MVNNQTYLQGINNRIATLEINFKGIMENLKILNIRINKMEELLRCNRNLK